MVLCSMSIYNQPWHYHFPGNSENPNNMARNDSQLADTHLVKALSRLLRPLVKFLLSKGFTYIRLIQIIRPLYVELADQNTSPNNSKLSDSRISVLTGIARRYVKELRNSDIPEHSRILKIAPSSKLIALWLTNPSYIQTNGKPRLLNRLGRDMDEASFEQLAELATNDVRPRTLLDDLLDKKLVRRTGDDQVELLAQAYQPKQGQVELIDIFGAHLHDHIAAASHNLVQEEDRYFDRSAFQDNLTAKSIEALKAFSEEHAMDLIKLIYAEAARLAAEEKSDPGNTFRFRVGAYVFAEDEGREQLALNADGTDKSSDSDV